MSVVLFDKFGSKINFEDVNQINFKNKDENKYLYQLSLYTKEDEPFLINNVCAYFNGVTNNNLNKPANFFIYLHKQSEPFSLYNKGKDLTCNFSEHGINLQFYDLDFSYYYRYLNCVEMLHFGSRNEDVKYKKGCFIFSDGTKIEFSDIISYQKEKDTKNDETFSFSIVTKKSIIFATHIAFYCFYNEEDFKGSLDFVINFAGCEFILKNVKRSDIELEFNKDKCITALSNSCKISYFYNFISYAYLKNNKNGSVVKIDFTPKEEHLLISL